MLTITLGIRRQLAAAFACSLSSMVAGCLMGWSAPTFRKLRESGSYMHISTYEEAWIVNALYVTTILSPFPSGAFMNMVGRKICLLVLSMFAMFSWILIFFSTNAYSIIVARALAGVWVGGIYTVVPIYIAEISQPQVRGISATFFMVAGFMGANFVFIVGPYVSFQLMAVLGGTLPMLFFILFWFCPESPYFYAMQKNHKAAIDSLSWFRGGLPVESELLAIETSIETESKDETGYFKKMLDLLTVPANRKAFIIVEVMSAVQRLSGISVIVAFSSVILPDRIGPLTADHCTLITGIVWMLSTLICIAFVDSVGRKPLLYFSSAGVSVSMLLTGVWYYLDNETTLRIGTFNWIPFAGFVIHGFTFSIGLGPLPATYQGEMFPSNLKGQASALTSMNMAFSSIVSTAMFVALTRYVGVYINFFIFSAFGLISFIFTYLYVIETKGKSLQMIQAELNKDTDDQMRSNENKSKNTGGD